MICSYAKNLKECLAEILKVEFTWYRSYHEARTLRSLLWELSRGLSGSFCRRKNEKII